MADKTVSDGDLRRLVLQVLSTTSTDDWRIIRAEVIKLLKEADLGTLGRQGEQRANQVIIGLIIEQLVTIGARGNSYSPRWPPIILTDLGRAWVDTTGANWRDPDEYSAFLRETAPGVERATVEYAVEAFKCLQQNLLFACAVMIGAAAEREIFRLGHAILSWEKDERTARKLREALDRGRLPSLFQEIRASVERAAQSELLPYSTHQGSVEHLLSFQEMIRSQRNDAVHSGALSITKDKVFLSIQTFPVALGVIDRLRAWFERSRDQ